MERKHHLRGGGGAGGGGGGCGGGVGGGGGGGGGGWWGGRNPLNQLETSPSINEREILGQIGWRGFKKKEASKKTSAAIEHERSDNCNSQDSSCRSMSPSSGIKRQVLTRVRNLGEGGSYPRMARWKKRFWQKTQ